MDTLDVAAPEFETLAVTLVATPFTIVVTPPAPPVGISVVGISPDCIELVIPLNLLIFACTLAGKAEVFNNVETFTLPFCADPKNAAIDETPFLTLADTFGLFLITLLMNTVTSIAIVYPFGFFCGIGELTVPSLRFNVPVFLSHGSCVGVNGAILAKSFLA